MKFECLTGQNDLRLKELSDKCEKLQLRENHLKMLVVSEKKKIIFLENILEKMSKLCAEYQSFSNESVPTIPDKVTKDLINTIPKKKEELVRENIEKDKIKKEADKDDKDDNDDKETQVQGSEEDAQDCPKRTKETNEPKVTKDEAVENLKQLVKRWSPNKDDIKQEDEKNENQVDDKPEMKNPEVELKSDQNVEVNENMKEESKSSVDNKEEETIVEKVEEKIRINESHENKIEEEAHVEKKPEKPKNDEMDISDLDDEEESEDTVSLIDSMMETEDDSELLDKSPAAVKEELLEDNDISDDDLDEPGETKREASKVEQIKTNYKNGEETQTQVKVVESINDGKASNAYMDLLKDLGFEVKTVKEQNSNHSSSPQLMPVMTEGIPAGRELGQGGGEVGVESPQPDSESDESMDGFDKNKIEVKNEPVETPVEEIKQQRKSLKNTLTQAWRVKTGRVEKTEKPRRRTTCKKCAACQVSADCGQCIFCLDKPKFGGPNKLKKKCREKICQDMSFQN